MYEYSVLKQDAEHEGEQDGDILHEGDSVEMQLLPNAYEDSANVPPEEEHPEHDIPAAMTSRTMWKNICVLAAAFVCLFTAYNGLVDLQSSLFIDAGLGVVTQSILYASFSLSCLVLPKLLIAKLGHKWSITLSMIGYILWMAANGYATWITMSVTSFIVGLCAAPLWTAQTTYLTTLGKNYSNLYQKDYPATIAFFFGAFNAMFKVSAFCGNTISWLILRHEETNSTLPVALDDLNSCGARDCPGRNSTNSHYRKVPDAILWTLVGCYLVVGCAGFFLSMFFLDPLPRGRKSDDPEDMRMILTATLRQHRKPEQLLLIPMAVYGGMAMTFIWADFNKSYVTCAIGIWMVGFVFLPSVVLDGMASLATGKLAECLHRAYLFVFVFLIDIVVLMMLLWWRPLPDSLALFYIVPAFLGLSAGIIHVLLNSLVAATFDDLESAYSCLRVWSALGAATAFGINKFVCVVTKIYINGTFLVLWFLCYCVLERVIKRNKTRQK